MDDISPLLEEIASEYPAALAYHESLRMYGGAIVDDIAPTLNANNARLMPLLMLARATRSLAAMELLFRWGFASEMYGHIRLIAELSYDLRWIRKSDTARRLKRFFDFAHRQGEIARRRYARYSPKMERQHQDALFRAFEKKFADPKIKSPAGLRTARIDASRAATKEHGFGKSPDWVTGYYPEAEREKEALGYRAAEVGLKDLYMLSHEIGSVLVHSNALSAYEPFRVEDNGAAAINPGSEIPRSTFKGRLRVAWSCYLILIEDVLAFYERKAKVPPAEMLKRSPTE